jgi:hypothetical protein
MSLTLQPFPEFWEVDSREVSSEERYREWMAPSKLLTSSQHLSSEQLQLRLNGFFSYVRDQHDNSHTYRQNFAFLADRVGAGKTNIILDVSFCTDTLTLDALPPCIVQDSLWFDNALPVALDRRQLNADVVLVQRNMLHQWDVETRIFVAESHASRVLVLLDEHDTVEDIARDVHSACETANGAHVIVVMSIDQYISLQLSDTMFRIIFLDDVQYESFRVEEQPTAARSRQSRRACAGGEDDDAVEESPEGSRVCLPQNSAPNCLFKVVVTSSWHLLLTPRRNMSSTWLYALLAGLHDLDQRLTGERRQLFYQSVVRCSDSFIKRKQIEELHSIEAGTLRVHEAGPWDIGVIAVGLDEMVTDFKKRSCGQLSRKEVADMLASPTEGLRAILAGMSVKVLGGFEEFVDAAREFVDRHYPEPAESHDAAATDGGRKRKRAPNTGACRRVALECLSALKAVPVWIPCCAFAAAIEPMCDQRVRPDKERGSDRAVSACRLCRRSIINPHPTVAHVPHGDDSKYDGPCAIVFRLLDAMHHDPAHKAVVVSPQMNLLRQVEHLVSKCWPLADVCRCLFLYDGGVRRDTVIQQSRKDRRARGQKMDGLAKKYASSTGEGEGVDHLGQFQFVFLVASQCLGFNLQAARDLIIASDASVQALGPAGTVQQVVGRVVRPVRTQPVNVHIVCTATSLRAVEARNAQDSLVAEVMACFPGLVLGAA